MRLAGIQVLLVAPARPHPAPAVYAAVGFGDRDLLATLRAEAADRLGAWAARPTGWRPGWP